jgi:hypothetical protein
LIGRIFDPTVLIFPNLLDKTRVFICCQTPKKGRLINL